MAGANDYDIVGLWKGIQGLGGFGIGGKNNLRNQLEGATGQKRHVPRGTSLYI